MDGSRLDQVVIKASAVVTRKELVSAKDVRVWRQRTFDETRGSSSCHSLVDSSQRDWTLWNSCTPPNLLQLHQQSIYTLPGQTVAQWVPSREAAITATR